MILGSLITTACTKKETASYSGDDISKDVTIIREKMTKAASLKIFAKGKWALFAGPSVDKIDFSRPIAEGQDSGTFPINVPNDVRSYFQIVTESGNAIVADKHLPMTGGYNFRDMGGYKTTDNKYVKWGKVFRSDDLHNLTDTDLNYLASIPLISIVDFRSGEEIANGADKNPSSVKENYAYSISPGNLMDAVTKDLNSLTPERADQLMMDMNVLLVTDSACIDQYRKYFNLLQNETDVPLMFHCSAGKDRTGMGAALFLYSLGVDEKTIMNDYLASNIYLANKYAKYKAENPALASLFEVKPEFLQAGIDRIKKDHGSVENYLTNVLDVDIAKMKSIYLY